jgi:hypothetical protein
MGGFWVRVIPLNADLLQKITAPTDLAAQGIQYFSRRNGAMLAIRFFIVRGANSPKKWAILR